MTENQRDSAARDGNDAGRASHVSTFERALAEERARWDRAIEIPCAWRTCVDYFDPRAGTIIGGAGSPLCGCDNLPGWRAARPESKPRPAFNVKARGRHGSRVQRSRRRRADWVAMVREWDR